MKAKRQILCLLLALVMVWQGFSFANAEGNSPEATAVVASEGAEASETSASTMERASAPAPAGKRIDNAISNVELSIDKVPLTDNTELLDYKSLQFKATIKVDSTVKEGDYISIQLPNTLTSKDISFDIKGSNNLVLAKAQYIEATKEMRIVFTKDAEGYSGADGEIFFNTRIDKSVVQSSRKVPLEFFVNGQGLGKIEVNQTIVGKDGAVSFWKSRDEKLIPLVDEDGITHYLIHYTVSIDERNIKKVQGESSFTDVVLTDTLQSDALSYFDVKNRFSTHNLKQSDIDTYTPKLRKGIWRSGQWVNGTWESATSDEEPDRGPNWSLRNKQDNKNESSVEYISPTYAADGRSFTYRIGNLEAADGLYFSYYVEITEAFKNGDILYNEAKINGNGLIQDEQNLKFIVNEAGGFLNGQNFNIQIKKTDENGNALAGAKFSIVNPKNKSTKTVVSGADGTVTLENVFMAEYLVTEVEAPEGYVLDNTPKTITVQDFKDSTRNNATVVLEIKNKKQETPKEKEFRDIKVEKKWVLDPDLATEKPEKIVVSILKNGVKDPALTAELRASNDWKTSFSNLPKKDDSGREILYTIAEEELVKFKAAISGTADEGFTISNYHGGKVVIPVTKIWRGEGNHPDSLKVYLYADGTKLATYTLNEANGWQHQFEVPKFKSDGTVTAYTVMEEQVNGYSSSTQNDPVTGYVNVFTNTKTPTTPPVTPPNTPPVTPPNTPPTTPPGTPPTTPSVIPPTTPSEIPPVTPGGNTPRTPGGGGNTPNNPGGGGNTPNPPTPPSEHPGEVLAAERTSEGNVLGAERPAVLGVGRGYTKTEDSRNIWVNLALFAIAGLGFYTSLMQRKRKWH